MPLHRTRSALSRHWAARCAHGSRTESARILPHPPDGSYVRRVTLDLPAMDDMQRAVMVELVQTVGTRDYDAMRPALAAAEQNRVLLTPPLISVAAALLRVLADQADEPPWRYSGRLWNDHLPDLRPAGRSEWRRATLTLHAAAGLSGGVWLDVEETESYYQAPLWPTALNVVQLLANTAMASTSLSPPQLATRLAQLLGTATPTTPPA